LRLQLAAPFDLRSAKDTWLAALAEAEAFAVARPLSTRRDPPLARIDPNRHH